MVLSRKKNVRILIFLCLPRFTIWDGKHWEWLPEPSGGLKEKRWRKERKRYTLRFCSWLFSRRTVTSWSPKNMQNSDHSEPVLGKRGIQEEKDSTNYPSQDVLQGAERVEGVPSTGAPCLLGAIWTLAGCLNSVSLASREGIISHFSF